MARIPAQPRRVLARIGPGVLEDGVTGYIVNSVEEAVEAVARINLLSRATCRRVFEERFEAPRMASDYLGVYGDVVRNQAA